MKPPSDRNLAELEAAVQGRVGFDPQSVGDHSLLRAVCQQMKEQRLSDGDAYVVQLLKDALEFESFVETLVVSETWFFRDRQPFRCLQDYANHHWRPSGLDDRLRVLSIPCSTGEEPYSIAMTLLYAGMLLSQFQVDAADLSRRALRRAADAVYGKASFRGDELEFPGLCDRFLDKQGERFVANAGLRETVRFFHANLISPSLLGNQPAYQVIFCRNVLIYLSADARRTALANLHRLLLPEGLLYVGHVEARIAAEGAFRQFSREYPFAFAPITNTAVAGASRAAVRTSTVPPFDKARAARIQAAAVVPSRANDTLSVRTTTRAGRIAPPIPSAPALKAEVADTSCAEKLASARVAADAGYLEETSGLCREVLAREPANAEALCLMGLVQKTRGQAIEAEATFQKVLYLEPGRADALVHMMLLAEQRGDEKSAANFRRRAEQAQSREIRR